MKRFNISNQRYNSITLQRYGGADPEPNATQNEYVSSSGHHSHGTYGALLFDERWLIRRKEILARDGDACVVCSSTESLQVHHRQYHFIKDLGRFKPPWDYADHLLITLCERCHSRGHNKFRVPNIYI